MIALRSPLREADLVAVAALAKVAVKTVRHYAAGRPNQRATTVTAIEAALRRLKLAAAAPSKAAATFDARTLEIPFSPLPSPSTARGADEENE